MIIKKKCWQCNKTHIDTDIEINTKAKRCPGIFIGEDGTHNHSSVSGIVLTGPPGEPFLPCNNHLFVYLKYTKCGIFKIVM